MYIQIGIKVMNVDDTVKSDNIIYKRKRQGSKRTSNFTIFLV